MESVNRVGVFFMWIGAICILLFLFSSIANSTICNLLVVGILFVIFGVYLWNKDKPPKAKNDRFRIFKNMKSKKDTPSPPKK